MITERSEELRKAMEQLTRRQQNMINLAVECNLKNVPVSRILKTPYSCQYCGVKIGQTGESRDARKVKLANHESQCTRNPFKWQFGCSESTYYTKWMPDPLFKNCLEKAIDEAATASIHNAAMTLKIAADDAARELHRLVLRSLHDKERRLAAVAILDRAEVGRVPDSLETDWWEAVDDDATTE